MEQFLASDSVAPQDLVEQLGGCRAAIEACLEWKGANDRERSVRAASENALASCLDALRVAEIGLSRARLDMIEAASRNLGAAHERVVAIARVLQQ